MFVGGSISKSPVVGLTESQVGEILLLSVELTVYIILDVLVNHLDRSRVSR